MDYDLDNRIIKVDVDNDGVEKYRRPVGVLDLMSGASEARRVKAREASLDQCAEHKHQAGQIHFIPFSLRQVVGSPPSLQIMKRQSRYSVVIPNDIMAHPSRLNSVIARAVDGSKFKLEWYHKNYLDHVYAVSDDSGDILEHYRYTAFGEVTIYNELGNQVTTTQIDNHILWNTRRRDEVTGYYMYKYRHYSPELGRWPSRDPIEEMGGVNLYGFVRNKPYNNIDFLGLATFYFSERAAATAAGNEAKQLGEKWDDANMAEIEIYRKNNRIPYDGMEFAGRICAKCYPVDESLLNSSLPDEYKKTIYLYSYTGPIRGVRPSELAKLNADIAKESKKEFDELVGGDSTEWLKNYGEEYLKNNPGKRYVILPDWVPIPNFGTAAAAPGNAPDCSTIGEGWFTISYYHSHPGNEKFGPGDKAFANAENKGLWVTRGPRGDSSKYITELYSPPNAP